MYTYTTEELDAMSIVEMRSALRKSEQERERAEEVAFVLKERIVVTLEDAEKAAHVLLALPNVIKRSTRWGEAPELTRLRSDLVDCISAARVTAVVEKLLDEMQSVANAAEPLLAPLDEPRRSPYADLRKNLDQARTTLTGEVVPV